MMRKIRILMLFLYIGFSACKKSPDFFIGKWQIVTMVENDKSTNLIDNWMHLRTNGTFDSYDGAIKKEESGQWTYEIKDKTLFIDGDGKDGDSKWILSIRNDTLFFHSTSSDLYLIAKKSTD